MQNTISKIKKRDNRIVGFDRSKITSAIDKALVAVKRSDGKTAEKISDKVVKILNKRFEEQIPHIEDIQDVVIETLEKEGFKETAKAYSEYRKKRREIREARYFLLDHDIKIKLTPNAVKVLESRYLKKNDEGKIIETPTQMFRRVAENIAAAEKFYNQDISDDDLFRTEERLYRMMVNLEFLPNSPTLMNAGLRLQQLSACFVLGIPDSMSGIFDAIKYTAIIHQSGGGTGFSFSNLRPKGDLVRTTQGIASGPISFMKVFDAATEVIKQGGKRRGANMGVLRIDHPDILEFINIKEQEGVLSNFNISVGITDDFMNKIEKGEDYDLINPKDGQVAGQLNARSVFDLIVKLAWTSGDPGVLFINRMNAQNPTPKLGRIETTNPCIIGSSRVSTKDGLVKISNLLNRPSEIATDGRVSRQNKEIIMCCDENSIAYSYNSKQIYTPYQKHPIISDKFRYKTESNLISFRNTSGSFETGVKDVYRLATKSGFEINTTKDHKIMTDEGWIEVRNLDKSKHKILIQGGSGSFSQSYDLPVKIKNDIVGENGRKYKFDFPAEWSRELGQIMGWLVGDGWLQDAKYKQRVGFVFSKQDVEVKNYLKPILEKIYNKTIKEKCDKKSGVRALSYHSKFFVEFFGKLGVTSAKAGEKTVPESIFTAPKEVVVGFLQGLFTADGTVNFIKDKSAYVRLTSKSENLLKDVQLLLINLGIFSRIYDRTRKEREKLFPYVNKNGITVYYKSDGVCFELEISKNSVLKFLDEVGFLVGKHSDKIAKFSAKEFYSDKFLDEITSIKYTGKEKVYDLTEPETHSFVANGIVIHNCGEVPLLPFESCNLGSINLSKILKEKSGGKKIKYEINFKKLKETVKNAVLFLDNVVDMNHYPLPEIEAMTKGNRKIGLGVMGWADMLIKLEIPYNSNKALNLAEKVMKFISKEAKKESINLARERGVFPNFQDSIYSEKGPRVRNATTNSIAPTGTISIIAGASSSIEPLFALAYTRIAYIGKTTEGEYLLEINPLFEEIAKREGFYSQELMEEVAKKGGVQDIEQVPEKWKKIFITALEIDPEWHIKMQAAFQKYTDLAVSKTINFPNNASIKDVEKAYMMAWKLGCKGLTIFRNESRQLQVITIGKKEDSLPPPHDTHQQPHDIPPLPPGSCTTCAI